MKLHMIYLMAINLVGFIAMFVDKQRAIHKKWRIPEKRLFLIVAIGGSLGGIIGMSIFRHKTKHPKFQYGFPIIFIIQIALTYMILINK
ncbi:MAG TPA: DUF1294 domain-containing protein [Epulopiscium sp.]|nr:DUF1294 domain-containing protein [Candidatus Epulonipiscium sp.]